MIASSAISDRGCLAARHTSTVAEVSWLHRTLLGGGRGGDGRTVKLTAHGLGRTTSRALRCTSNTVRCTTSAARRSHSLERARRGGSCRSNNINILSCMPSRRALLWLAGAALLSSASAHIIASQGLSPTAEISSSFELSEATATQSSGKLPTRSPVNMTLYFPTNGVNPDLPWVMMMNGANCYSQDYTFLLSRLAGRGYLAVVPTQLHPKPPEFQSNDLMNDEEQQCDRDSIAIVTGSLVNDVHTLLTTLKSQDPSEQSPIPHITPEAQGAIKNVNLESFVVVSHSAGAVTAIDMLTGRCKAEKQAEQLCGNYTAILDKDGKGALKGVLAYEGYTASGITVPENTFLTYMAGQYNNKAEEKFHETKGECVQYVKLQAGNHYAITDWNPDTAPHQRSPCAAHIPADDPNFTTTREEQEERLVFIAQYTNAVIRAKLLGDSAAAHYVMREVPGSPLVQAADISPACFEATMQTASH